tara:strand:- start:8 stop:430 length:423 start_codon:yes stop_codon:yes gene_type:complete
MKDKKCNSQQAEFYLNDLFEMLDIKGNNQSLFNEFCQLLMKYSVETIKKSWKDVVFSCDLPNGQMAGRLPKMKEVQKILLSNRMENHQFEHNNSKRQNEPDGLVSKLWDWGLQLRDGLITEQELDNKIQNYSINKKQYRV